MSPRDPYAVLLAVLDNAEPGADWTVDSWRDEITLADLRGAEVVAAHQRAVDEGYLKVLGNERPGGFCHLSRASRHAASKGRPVQVYERTARRVQSASVVEPGTLFWEATG